MSERLDLNAKLELNEAKLQVLKQCAARIEADMLRLAERLAAEGYTKEQILEVVEAQRPAFDEAVKRALRSVTIMEMLESASDG